MNISIKKGKNQTVIDYLLLTILTTFPIAINISFFSPKDFVHPLISVNLSISDFLLLIALIIWLLKILIYKELRQIKLPIPPILVFVGIATLSIVNASSISDSIKELIKIVEYFIVFYILLINNLKNTKLNSIKNLLFITTTIILLIAFVQYSILKGSPYLIRGLFDNRNILGAYLCMTIPLVFAELLYEKNLYRKIWFLLMLFTSATIILSSSALLALVICLFIVSTFHSKSAIFKYAIGIVFLTLIYYYVLPQKNRNSLKEFGSIYEEGNVSENYYKTLTVLYDLKKTIYFNKMIGKNKLVVSNFLLTSSIMPQIRKGDAYADMNGERHLKNRYLEMRAALNMIANNGLLGAGLGNFQNQINVNYVGLPKINTEEPDQHNGYLLIGATTGIMGLTALFWTFFSTLRNIYKKFKNLNNSNKKLYLGLLGAIIAIMIENFFTSIFISILLVPFITLLYLSTKNSPDEVVF